MFEAEKEITKLMRPHGYKRKARCWYKVHPEVIPYLHLQRSKYGDEGYINICAVFPKLYNYKILPNSTNSDLYSRLPDLDQTEALKDYSLLEPSERRAILSKHLNEVAIPFLEKMTDIESTASVVRDETLYFTFFFSDLLKIGMFKAEEAEALRKSNIF